MQSVTLWNFTHFAALGFIHSMSGLCLFDLTNGCRLAVMHFIPELQMDVLMASPLSTDWHTYLWVSTNGLQSPGLVAEVK